MDIVKAVISPYGLSLSDETTGSYKPLEYCTQYDETDFNFISRLTEQFGIYYWFEHTDGDNKVVFGDDRSAYTPCPNVSELKYAPEMAEGEDLYHSNVSDIRATSTMVTGKFTSWDYDYRTYAKNANGPAVSTVDPGKNALERFAYPTGEAAYAKAIGTQLTTPAQGVMMVNAERDASDAGASLYHGVSSGRSFVPGYTFDLTDHPRDDWNQTYLLTEVAHHAEQTPPYASDSPTRAPYSNRFTAIESTVAFRPIARTPKPRIYGPQTAKVTYPSGEEIYIDKLGRICVLFFWDRARTINGVDNTWVRVAQPWAGSGWGTYFWPRMGDEVVVQFLNGDPDCPVITGSVYNGLNVPKYALPDMSTRSGIVTRSSKGGGAANANELRFEDKTGSEQIFINAEKDIDLRVENDGRRYVGGQDSLIVKTKQLVEIGTDHHNNVKGNVFEKVAANASREVGSDLKEKIGQDYSLQVGGNLAEKVGTGYTMDSGQTIYLKAGMTLVIESGVQLTLKCAGSFVTLGPAGVAISGTTVLINSGGAAGSGSAGDIKDPDPVLPPDEADDGTKGGAM